MRPKIFYQNLLYIINHWEDPNLQMQINQSGGHYGGWMIDEYAGTIIGTQPNRYRQYFTGPITTESINQLFINFSNDPDNYRKIQRQAYPFGEQLTNQELDLRRANERLPISQQKDLTSQFTRKVVPNIQGQLNQAYEKEKATAKYRNQISTRIAIETERINQEKQRQQLADKVQQVKQQLADEIKKSNTPPSPTPPLNPTSPPPPIQPQNNPINQPPPTPVNNPAAAPGSTTGSQSTASNASTQPPLSPQQQQQQRIQQLTQQVAVAEAEHEQFNQAHPNKGTLSIKTEFKNIKNEFDLAKIPHKSLDQKVKAKAKELSEKGVSGVIKKTLGPNLGKKVEENFGNTENQVFKGLTFFPRMRKYIQDKAKQLLLWLLRLLGRGLSWLGNLISSVLRFLVSHIWGWIGPTVMKWLAKIPFANAIGEALSPLIDGIGSSWIGTGLSWIANGIRWFNFLTNPLEWISKLGSIGWNSVLKPVLQFAWNEIASPVLEWGWEGLTQTVLPAILDGGMALLGAIGDGLTAVISFFGAVFAGISIGGILIAVGIGILVGVLVYLAGTNIISSLQNPNETNNLTVVKGFVGVNIPNLVTQTPDKIDSILSYLSNNCGTTVIRTFFASDQIDISKLQSLLAEGEKYNIKFIIALADFANRPNDLLPFPAKCKNTDPPDCSTDPTGWYKDQYQGRYLQHVIDTVNAVKDSPAIYGWELANEPHCNGDPNCSQYYTKWVQDMAKGIRVYDTNTSHIISIGTQANNDINLGDSLGDGEYQTNNSDPNISALTGHYYDGTPQGNLDNNEFQKEKTQLLGDKTQSLKGDLEVAQALNKPFYVGEAGFIPGSDRATIVKQEMDDFFNNGAAGYLIWMYSGNSAAEPNNPDGTSNPNGKIDSDAFSFYGDDALCNVMKQEAQSLVVQVPSTSLSCQFTRSDQNPPATSFQSPKLLSYFDEASKLSTVPSSVLAAIARVESPGSVNFTDQDIDNYKCIPSGDGKNVSDTGARGIMQLEPPPTIDPHENGYDSDAIVGGAKLLGKTIDQLTEADFCNPRENIIMAAGFILKKVAYAGYGDGTKWDPSWTTNSQVINALAKGYYGCLKYPTCEDKTTGLGGGPYSYGQDLYTSILSCQNATVGSTLTSTGGERIAQAAEQIANQLQSDGAFDTNGKWNPAHLTYQCEGAIGPDGHFTPLTDGLDGFHCLPPNPAYNIGADIYYFQCTELVYAAFAQAGPEYLNKIQEIDHGNAAYWAQNALKLEQSGNKDFHVFTNESDAQYLQPGDIISLSDYIDGIDYGHVAIVINVSHNDIEVAQAATNKPIEVWHFNPQTGKLDAGGNSNRVFTTGSLLVPPSGFIRLMNTN